MPAQVRPSRYAWQIAWAAVAGDGKRTRVACHNFRFPQGVIRNDSNHVRMSGGNPGRPFGISRGDEHRPSLPRLAAGPYQRGTAWRIGQRQTQHHDVAPGRQGLLDAARNQGWVRRAAIAEHIDGVYLRLRRARPDNPGDGCSMPDVVAKVPVLENSTARISLNATTVDRGANV